MEAEDQHAQYTEFNASLGRPEVDAQLSYWNGLKLFLTTAKEIYQEKKNHQGTFLKQTSSCDARLHTHAHARLHTHAHTAESSKAHFKKVRVKLRGIAEVGMRQKV